MALQIAPPRGHRLEDVCLSPSACPHPHYLHDMAKDLQRDFPQLFLSKYSFGFYQEDTNGESQEIYLALEGTTAKDSRYSSATLWQRSSLWGFMDAFSRKQSEFHISLIKDFGISPTNYRLFAELLFKIINTATKSKAAMYLPIPTFYLLFMVDYIATMNGPVHDLSQRACLRRLSYDVLSEPYVPASALDRLTLTMNELIRLGIEANPNCSEGNKVVYAMGLGKSASDNS